MPGMLGLPELDASALGGTNHRYWKQAGVSRANLTKRLPSQWRREEPYKAYFIVEGSAEWLPTEPDVSIRSGWYWTVESDDGIESVDPLLDVEMSPTLDRPIPWSDCEIQTATIALLWIAGR